MRIISLSFALTLVACGGGDKGTSPTGVAAGTTTGSTTLGGVAGGTASADRSASLTGEIFDCNGSGLPGVEIRFCDPTGCINRSTEVGATTYEYAEALVGWHSLELVPPLGSDLATGFVPLTFDSNEARVVDIIMCSHGPATALVGGAAEMELGTGLFVTLSQSGLEPPLFVDPATEAAGVLLDPSHWVPTDEITGTVAAQWFAEPFNHHSVSPDGLPFRIDGTAVGLMAASYHVYVGSYDDFAWLDAGTVSDADADGWYDPDADGALPLVGTVMLVEQ